MVPGDRREGMAVGEGRPVRIMIGEQGEDRREEAQRPHFRIFRLLVQEGGDAAAQVGRLPRDDGQPLILSVFMSVMSRASACRREPGDHIG